MGADVDSSAPTSSIRNVLLAGGCGLRQTISNMTTLPQCPGLQPDCRIPEGQARPSVLCVSAPPLFPGSCKAGAPLTNYLATYVIFAAALAKKECAQLSHVC